MIRRSDIYRSRKSWMIRHNSYSFRFYKYFDYSLLNKIIYIKRRGRGSSDSYNDIIIMADTETSKEVPATICKNYVVAWTISLRAFDENIVTLYGNKPSEMITCINNMIMALPGDNTIIYVHNLAYDWVFLRKHMMREWGTPEHQLNVKSHYPISIKFENGIILRDSLILSQRSLDKWAKDLNVKHQKACGFWDYDKVRHQSGRFTPHEKTYIEHDTLAGVECIQSTMDVLHKDICSLPLTATGIPREEVRKRAKNNRGREFFLKIVPPYAVQIILEKVFHGGYTHNNRHYIERIVSEIVEAFDEASAYPYAMLAYKFPMGKFSKFKNCTPEFILENAENYAYIFKLIMVKPRLKSDNIPMPALQKSKAEKMINAIEDNGRILCAEYFEIYLNEIDLEVIMQQYDYDSIYCVDVYFCTKDFLPRWFTDYIYECFVAKTKLKGGDPVLYSIAKAKLNSLYGMTVQKPVKLTIEEDYQSGEYSIPDDQNPEEIYEKYVKNPRSVLPYQWGVWVTSIAFRNLFTIGSCAGTWLYSDTDSCYGQNWDKEKLDAYNESCKKRLLDRGYGGVLYNGREYWLGICELDGTYSEFVSVGAKRYCCRDAKSGLLKITVAGVPKAGRVCLKDDIRNFKTGFIFDGETTGKKQHTYFIEEDIWTDANGNERADSIDLSPASYLLDSVREFDWESFFEEEIAIKIFDDDLYRRK